MVVREKTNAGVPTGPMIAAQRQSQEQMDAMTITVLHLRRLDELVEAALRARMNRARRRDAISARCA